MQDFDQVFKIRGATPPARRSPSQPMLSDSQYCRRSTATGVVGLHEVDRPVDDVEDDEHDRE